MIGLAYNCQGRMNKMHKFSLQTSTRDQMIDITREVQAFIDKQEIHNGIVTIYCPHTTGGITINENADPDVVRDFLRRLDEVFPWYQEKDCHGEGNTAAHLKASTVGSSQTVIIEKGRMLLGTWQGIYFCEFDGPRRRNVYMKIIGD